MFNPENVINADLVIKEIPELACFDNFVEFLKALPRYLGVQVPATVTNVIVSNIQPTSSQTTDLWIRLDNSGSFIGIYIFSQGKWQPIYPISVDSGDVATQIQWFYSADGSVTPGWVKIDTDDPILPPDLVTQLKTQYFSNSASVVVYYAAYFTGF